MSWVSGAWDWYAAHSDKVNPIVAGLGGAAVVWAAVRQARTATNRHYEQTRSDQQRRLTESFSKAVEQLSDRDKIEARLGGIYTLERLAIEAIAQVRPLAWSRRLQPRFLSRKQPPPSDPVSDLYWTVMETLTAFVRERARWQGSKATAAAMAGKSDYLWGSNAQSAKEPDEAQPREPATDVAAVLAVLRRRPGRAMARGAARLALELENDGWPGWITQVQDFGGGSVHDGGRATSVHEGRAGDRPQLHRRSGETISRFAA